MAEKCINTKVVALKISNNTDKTLSVSILENSGRDNFINATTEYSWNITGQSYVDMTTVSIQVKGQNQDFVTYTGLLTSRTPQGVIDALNKLNIGTFYIKEDAGQTYIVTKNDTLIFGTIDIYNPDVWVLQTAIDSSWLSVAYGNGVFVAVSTFPPIKVMTSPDGINWTARASSDDSAQWAAVTFGDGKFVAVATAGESMTSIDGINWTPVSPIGNSNCRYIAYGNGLFVTVRQVAGPGPYIYSSPDGINWTPQTSDCENWLAFSYGNGNFFGFGFDAFGPIALISPDGINWTSSAISPDFVIQGAAFGKGLYVGVGFDFNLFVAVIITSPDGINWTQRTAPADNQWWGLTFGDGKFVSTATSGTGDRVMISYDGITWQTRASAGDFDWRSVTYGGLFVAVSFGGGGVNSVMTSVSGL